MTEEIYHFNQRTEDKRLIRFDICGITFPDKGYHIHRMYSRIHCIEYIEEGTGVVNVDNTTFYPSEGDAYFLQAGKEHRYHSDRKRPWKKYFINFSGPLADRLAEAYGVTDVSHFVGLDIKNELLHIIELGKNSHESHTEELIGILNGILLKMHHAQSGERESQDIAEQMKQFLDTQVTEKFRIEALCHHIARSESQTIRIFKKAYGIPPYTYVLNKKIALAKRLLRDTALPIKEIADKLCFADEYYFSDFFKQKTGVTPSAYRQREGNGQEGEPNLSSKTS